MKIAIWTLKEPKVEAIKSWIEVCPYFENKTEIEYILKSVPSDISNMPLTLEETSLWAKNRAQNVKKLWEKADYYIWIEGWVWDIMWKKYLFWVVYVENKHWEWHFWYSPFIEVPELINHKLFIENLELWPIMSELSWIVNIWSKNWSMWAWSDDMFTRSEQFELAFKAAISPFYNKFYKI